MGAGYVVVRSFTIDGKNIATFPSDSPFNFKCLGEERMAIAVVVRSLAGGAIEIERCTADDWTWESGYKAVSCVREKIS